LRHQLYGLPSRELDHRSWLHLSSGGLGSGFRRKSKTGRDVLAGGGLYYLSQEGSGKYVIPEPILREVGGKLGGEDNWAKWIKGARRKSPEAWLLLH